MELTPEVEQHGGDAAHGRAPHRDRELVEAGVGKARPGRRREPASRPPGPGRRSSRSIPSRVVSGRASSRAAAWPPAPTVASTTARPGGTGRRTSTTSATMTRQVAERDQRAPSATLRSTDRREYIPDALEGGEEGGLPAPGRRVAHGRTVTGSSPGELRRAGPSSPRPLACRQRLGGPDLHMVVGTVTTTSSVNPAKSRSDGGMAMRPWLVRGWLPGPRRRRLVPDRGIGWPCPWQRSRISRARSSNSLGGPQGQAAVDLARSGTPVSSSSRNRAGRVNLPFRIEGVHVLPKEHQFASARPLRSRRKKRPVGYGSLPFPPLSAII